MTGVQTCALPICFPVTITQEEREQESMKNQIREEEEEKETGDNEEDKKQNEEETESNIHSTRR